MSEYNERKQNIGVQWIKAKESGRSYLCPVGSVNKETATESELKAACVDESDNPQND